ncbi:MAG: PDZ domain-containing protein, partial [Cyanobacteria bacterium J069]
RGQVGLLVLEVATGGIAAGALLPGDVLLSANGQPFGSAEDLLSVLDDLAPGDKVRLEYGRNPSFPRSGGYQVRVYTLQVPQAIAPTSPAEAA